MVTIKILGIGDLKTQALKDNLGVALQQYPLNNEVVEVSEVNRIAVSGVSETPALLFDDQIISEGRVPSVEELMTLLRNRWLYKSKLYILKKILVPVDLSENSENALRFAWEIARKFDASITVVHVLQGVFDGDIASSSGFMNHYLRESEAELRSFVAAVFNKYYPGESSPVMAVAAPGGPGENTGQDLYRIHLKVDYGFPAETLVDLSQQFDLAVMGTSGKGALTAELFGSVSVHLSHEAHCPVLLVPPNVQETDFKSILYASNFESNDPEKIKQVVAFAKKFDAQLHFVHVGKPNEPGEKLEQTLFEVNYRFSDPEKPFIFQKMVGDDVEEKLNEYAFYHKTDLYVFVTPRRGFWQNLLHRSKTRNLLLHTKTPILIVHQFNDLVNN